MLDNNLIKLEEIRQLLREKRAVLLENIQDELNMRQAEVFNPDTSDLAYDYVAREKMTILLTRMQEHLERVETALKRVDDGTYGFCTNCGNPIAATRLRTLPEAMLCRHCQDQIG